MATRRKSKFKEHVAEDVHDQKNATSSYGYLNLPQGLNVFQPEEGRVTFDILPYEVTVDDHPDHKPGTDKAAKGELWFKRPFRIHRNIGAAQDSVVCLMGEGKPCPICKERDKKRKKGADKEDIDALKSTLRNLYIVRPIGHKKHEDSYHIWDISQYCFQKQLVEELDEKPKYNNFPDLEEGFSLNTRFEEKQLGSNKFISTNRIDFEERDEIYEWEVLDEVPNLDEILNILSYEDLEAKFLEIDDEPAHNMDDDDDEPIEDAPAPKRTRSKPKPKPKPRDEEPEEESAQDEDPSEILCIACEGTGQNSKGRTCPICRGSGIKPADPKPIRSRKAEPIPEEEPKPVRRRTRKAPEPEPEPEGDDRCPHGYVFGVDTNEKDECLKCNEWEDCIDEKEAGK